MPPPIINCHIHTFTVDHVPVNFLPLKLGLLFKIPLAREPLRWLLSTINPLDNRDMFSRYANFIKVSSGKSQRDVFDTIRGRYPVGTRFVVLPMDMAYMGAGAPPKPLDQQHEELAAMRDNLPDLVIPFAAVDPRRPNILKTLRHLVEDRGFKGIKVYPNLGYRPNDPILMEVWKYAEAKSLPVMTHCSRGGPRHRYLTKEALSDYTAPGCWVPVLEAFPALRICLAHLGGSAEWELYFRDGWDPNKPSQRTSWVSEILDLIRAGKYPNLYTDISYTIFNFDDYAPAIKVFLADAQLREKILFGSDFYMIENERFEERLLSMRLRALLGEELFWQIADANPRKYLG